MMPHVNQLVSSSNEQKFQASRAAPEPLTSWKEIAAYLGKGVRTVQRWERELALPVARVDGSTRVIANCHEIDEWLRTKLQVRPPTRDSKERSPLQKHNARLQRLHELMNQSAERAFAANRKAAECLAQVKGLSERTRS
jgi:DNA-binding transcriptional regulator YiaG